MVIYSAEELDNVFGALANQTRRLIVRSLSQQDQTVLQLAQQVSISQPGVTKHLNVLEKSGLIQRRREGRKQICSLNAETLQDAHQWIGYFDAFWDEKLEALSKHVETKNG
jgi:DNA-binding transcriptional ArsR family regulator